MGLNEICFNCTDLASFMRKFLDASIAGIRWYVNNALSLALFFLFLFIEN